MAFKMNGFSGFKDVSQDAVEAGVGYAGEKLVKKEISDQLKKQLIKGGFRGASKFLGPIGPISLAVDAGILADKINPDGNTVTRLKEDRKNNPNFGRKI
tara:strand:+ start:514 stop:810 length:297 start_codon:yes stop_codon:yes gene_type:complete